MSKLQILAGLENLLENYVDLTGVAVNIIILSSLPAAGPWLEVMNNIVNMHAAANVLQR